MPIYSNQDHVILETVKELFTKRNKRRILIQLIGVRFSNLIPGNYQIYLFNDTQEQIRLYQRIDSIKRQFGEKYILCESGQLINNKIKCFRILELNY